MFLNKKLLTLGELMEMDKASAGHKIGQMVGDWFEEYFVLLLLDKVASELGLFLDSRFKKRKTRGEKIIWADAEGNEVDYDFVLELGGTEEKIGFPVAFFETFWRRGSRHSKDKARDDTNKLLPMKYTYPTVRFLSIVAAGEFTNPAKEYVRSNGIELFYITKKNIIDAFNKNGLIIDYPDKASEEEKNKIFNTFDSNFNKTTKEKVQMSLIELLGEKTIDSYVSLIKLRLSSSPQQFSFVLKHSSLPLVFDSIEDANDFIENGTIKMSNPSESFVYQVIYIDGTEFQKEVNTKEELKEIHQQMTLLYEYMKKIK